MTERGGGGWWTFLILDNFSRVISGLKQPKIISHSKWNLVTHQETTKIYKMFKQGTGTMILLVYVGNSSRQAREGVLIQKGRTIYLDSLNIRDEKS